MTEIKNRILISFDGKCNYNCKHCYTFEIEQTKQRNIEELLDSIKQETFDIVYISQKRENFINPDEGLNLCEAVFDKFNCNIMIITRSVFNQKQIDRLISLNEKITKKNKHMFIGISVIGLDSAKISEDLSIVPSTIDRMDFAKKLYNFGITTLLLIRPLFPAKMIPTKEIEAIVDYVKENISCILTGTLMTNQHILKRLNIQEREFNYLPNGESEYLQGTSIKNMRFVDTSEEKKLLQSYCKQNDVPFFEHSMPAINYLINNIKK